MLPVNIDDEPIRIGQQECRVFHYIIYVQDDSGQIGFHRQPHALYLIFPHELPQQKDAKVVGIKYEKVDRGFTSAAKSIERKQPEPEKPEPKPAPVQHSYSAAVRRIIISEKQIHFKAHDKTEATRIAKDLASDESFSDQETITRVDVRDIKEE